MMKNIKGFSLLEIMIAVFVLSIGLLGLAKLQAASLKTNQSATLRSQVTMLAADMFDSMRANQVEAEAGSYILTLAAEPPAAAPPPPTISGQDLVLWFNNLRTFLPAVGTDASISCVDINVLDLFPCTAGSVYTINIIWNEYAYGAGDVNKSVQQATFTYSGAL